MVPRALTSWSGARSLESATTELRNAHEFVPGPTVIGMLPLPAFFVHFAPRPLRNALASAEFSNVYRATITGPAWATATPSASVAPRATRAVSFVRISVAEGRTATH